MSDHRLRLLVIDDDDLILQSLRMALPAQWSMQGFNSLPHDNADYGKFDAAFVDLHLSKDSSKPECGITAIQRLSKINPTMEIVAMSGDQSRELMEQVLVAGATRFLAKPLGLDELHLVLNKIEALLFLRRASGKPLGRGDKTIQPWIGYSPASVDLQRKIAHLRGERGPILIEGPSGSGKEVVAGLLHFQEGDESSSTKQQPRPLVSINVAAIPENLFESELFGHTKGAFTGAENHKMGLIEAASGGDLFLDEIEALSEKHQAKLLRFLENGELRRVGAKETIATNVRVIAATNRNLEEMVKKGEFREDLLWRLAGKKIKVPPLTDRRDDIPLLAKFFGDLEKPRRNKTWTEDALVALQKHDWPGNVRELKRICEQLCLISPLPIIRADDVAQVLQPTISSQRSKNIDFGLGLSRLIADFESEIIRTSLDRHRDIDATANVLGISRSSLYKKIKDHRIEL